MEVLKKPTKTETNMPSTLKEAMTEFQKMNVKVKKPMLLPMRKILY